MSIETLKGQTEKELRGRLNELNSEIFKSRFSTEAMNPRKGSEISSRRREIARIHTVLQGRAALARRQEEAKKLELQLAGMGKPHEGTVEDKRRRSLLARRLADARRAVVELSREAAPVKAEKPVAKAEKPAAKVEDKPKEKAEKPARAAKAEKAEAPAKAEKPAKKETKAADKPKAKKKAEK